jgi:hypothetical protein
LNEVEVIRLDGFNTGLIGYRRLDGAFGDRNLRDEFARLAGFRMRFSRAVFGAAAIYGLIVLLPLYFLETSIGQTSPPPITHPEYFYGFVGTTSVMQLVYLAIAIDPARFRPLMPIGALAKFSFFVPNLILFLLGRVPAGPLAFSSVDLCFGLLFLLAFLKTAHPRED